MTIASTIIRERLEVKRLAIAAGIVSIVITKTIPTTWINSTIETAIKMSRSK